MSFPARLEAESKAAVDSDVNTTECNNYFKHVLGTFHSKKEGQFSTHSDDDRINSSRHNFVKKASIFDYKTKSAVTPVGKLGKLGINFHDFMPYISVSQSVESPNPSSSLKAFEEMNEKSKTIKEVTDTTFSKVLLLLNYQSTEIIRAFGVSAQDVESYDDYLKREVANMSPVMKMTISRLQKAGRRPIFVDIKFNLDYAAHERVFIGNDTWANDFQNAVSIGRLRLIIEGNDGTIKQLKNIMMLFDQQRQYNPLNKFYRLSKKRITKLDYMVLKPASSFQYSTRCCFHSWEEYATIYSNAIANEYSQRAAQISRYEDQTTSLRLVEIPGSNGHAYLGTLSVPNDEKLRLEPGTACSITFVDPKRKKQCEAATIDQLFEKADLWIEKLRANAITALTSTDADDGSGQAHTDVGLTSGSKIIHDQSEADNPTEPSSTVGTADDHQEDESLTELDSRFTSFEMNSGDWPGRFIQSTAFCPSDQVPLIVTRPWIVNRHTPVGKEWNPHLVKTVDFPTMESLGMLQALREGQCQPVTIMIDISRQTLVRNLAALEKLKCVSRSPTDTEWTIRMKACMVGNKMHTLEPIDMLKHLREEFPVPESLMSLDHDQLQAVKAGEAARNGVQFIEGVSGSGKTHLVSSVINLHAQSKKSHSVLVTAPSNVALDSLVTTAIADLRELQAVGKADKSKYYVRLHSNAAEKDIAMMEAGITSPDISQSHPLDDGTSGGLEQLTHAQLLVRQTYDSENTTKYKSIKDRRVQTPLDHSVGYVMLQVAGVKCDNPDIIDKSDFGFSNFCDYYNQLVRGEDLDDITWECFKADTSELFDRVLENAAAVFTTTTNANSPKLLKAIASKVEMVIVHGAAREREDSLWPIFAADFSRNPTLLCVGDLCQLGPSFQGSSQDNRFAKQLEVSLMDRMLRLGFESSVLSVQHRMVSDISAMANYLSYADKLVDAPSVDLSKRPRAAAFRKYVSEEIGHDGNILLLDVADSSLAVVRVGSMQSRYNELFAILMVETALKLIELLPGASIALCTAYTAQRSILSTAVNSMHSQKLEGAENIEAVSIELAQGRQFDVVIMGLLVTSTAGFLADPRRLNVAITRPKDGLVVVGNLNSIKRLKPHQSSDLRKLGQYLSQFSKGIMAKHCPICEYYTPEQCAATASTGKAI